MNDPAENNWEPSEIELNLLAQRELLQSQLTAAQSRITELERLLRETQDKWVASECAVREANERITDLETHNARLSKRVAELEQAIRMAIATAANREDEWGERAVACFEILQQWLMKKDK